MNATEDPRRATYFDEAPEFDEERNEIATLGYIGRKNGASFSSSFSLVAPNWVQSFAECRIQVPKCHRIQILQVPCHKMMNRCGLRINHRTRCKRKLCTYKSGGLSELLLLDFAP